MVVDDEEFCIAAMKGMLKSSGIEISYHVDFCISGKEAIEKFIESYKMGCSYRLIFTDFQMPIMNGIDSTKRMRSFLTD